MRLVVNHFSTSNREVPLVGKYRQLLDKHLRDVRVAPVTPNQALRVLEKECKSWFKIL